MNQPIELSASQITNFLRCREYWRLNKIERITPVKPSIHQVFGKAVHRGVEMFWKGDTYENAYQSAALILTNTDQSLLNPQERKRLEEMWDSLPDMLACYFEEHEQLPAQQEMVERQWLWVNYLPGVHLKGIIDRFTKRGELYELKTASEVKPKTWKRDYKEAALRDFALGLYDWYLCQSEMRPTSIQMEVLLKPWKDKGPRIETIELNEIMYYRTRFEQQLKWVVSEMVHHVKNYYHSEPWPMATKDVCVGKYGVCDYLKICNYGRGEKIMKFYQIQGAAA